LISPDSAHLHIPSRIGWWLRSATFALASEGSGEDSRRRNRFDR